jgi:hypothetical protein
MAVAMLAVELTCHRYGYRQISYAPPAAVFTVTVQAEHRAPSR